MERAFHGAFAAMAGGRVGAASSIGAQSDSVLRTSGKVEFQVSGLCAGPAGPTPVCCSAISKLVSASGFETGKLEGENLSRLTLRELISIVHGV